MERNSHKLLSGRGRFEEQPLLKSGAPRRWLACLSSCSSSSAFSTCISSSRSGVSKIELLFLLYLWLNNRIDLHTKGKELKLGSEPTPDTVNDFTFCDSHVDRSPRMRTVFQIVFKTLCNSGSNSWMEVLREQETQHHRDLQAR